MRDIAAGEEITEDYALLSLRPEEAFACRCDSPRCRGHVGPHDVVSRMKEWKRILRHALSRVGTVSQPLQPLMRDEYLAEARRFAE